MKGKWFSTIQSIEQLKKEYRKLSLEYHPDTGGDEETFKEIYAEFEQLLEGFMHASFSQYEEETGKEAYGNAFVFADILKEVIHFNITIQIIGYWIYAFNSYEYKDYLKEKGFWFSKKHKAWVYSGGQKRKVRTNYSLSNIKDKYGVQEIRDKEEQVKICHY